jgi:hypothetical protein
MALVGGRGRGGVSVKGLPHRLPQCLFSRLKWVPFPQARGWGWGVSVKRLLYRVPPCLSSPLNWVPPGPNPSPASERGSPHLGPIGGSHTRLRGLGGVVGPNSEDLTDTVILYTVHNNPCTSAFIHYKRKRW